MNRSESPYKYLGWVSRLGLTMIGCIGFCLYIGVSLDGRFKTSPWCSLVFLVLGMVSGGWAIYRGIMRDFRDSGD